MEITTYRLSELLDRNPLDTLAPALHPCDYERGPLMIVDEGGEVIDGLHRLCGLYLSGSGGKVRVLEIETDSELDAVLDLAPGQTWEALMTTTAG